MSVVAAARAVMLANLAHLQANEQGVLEGENPDFIHQMRVALRRLRSAVAVFRPALPAGAADFLARELTWLARVLGRARDWDVLVTATLPALAGTGRHAAAARALQRRYAEQRREARRKARSALESPRYRVLVRALARGLSGGDVRGPRRGPAREKASVPACEFSARVLDKRYARVARHGRGLHKLTARQLHRLRIALKKFRYAADFFAGVYRGGRTRKMLDRLAQLQEVLGEINDVAGMMRIVGSGTEPARIARLWGQRRVTGLRKDLGAAWRKFEAARPFW
jgi:triphosphatase